MARPGIEREIQKAARKYRLDPVIFRRQLVQESGLNENAVSPAGAKGIAQFMPETAPGYGVNLNDGRVTDDINGAAKYLSDGLKRYKGDYRKALAAYNAGFGAVDKAGGVPPYAETQNYVRKIIGNRNPRGNPAASTGPVPTGGDQGGSTTKTTTTVRGAGFDAGQVASVLASQIQSQQQARPTITATAPTAPQFAASAPTPSGYAGVQSSGVQPRSSSLAEQIQAASEQVGQSIPQTSVTTKTTSSPTRNGGSSSSPKGTKANGPFGGPLLELFYNGKGGVNVKNGKRVPTGFVDGHTDHVHVAAGPKTIRTLAKLAQDMGLAVRELKGFDNVDPVHTTNSYHYRNQAADISGDPAKMAEYSRRVARLFGVKA